MKPFEREDRVKNFPPSEWRQKCESCGDDGLLAIANRREGGGMMPVMGPCPFCLKGLQVEFPVTDQGPKKGRWGSEGFWQGQEIPMELLRHWKQNQPLQQEENIRRMKELHERMAVIQAGGDPGKPSWEWGDGPEADRSPFQPSV